MNPSFFGRALAWLRTLPANEPVLLGQGVGLGLTIGVSLGLHLTPPQILGVASGVQSVAAYVMRAVVSPAPTSPPSPSSPTPT